MLGRKRMVGDAEERLAHRPRGGGVARVTRNGGIERQLPAIKARRVIADLSCELGDGLRSTERAQDEIGCGVVAPRNSRCAKIDKRHYALVHMLLSYRGMWE